jgi:hypothetical protein
MPTISIWLNPTTYEYISNLSKHFNESPNKLIKKMIEDKVKEPNKEHYNRVKSLYKWLYYEGEYITHEGYIRRILKKNNSEAILSIIKLNDDLRVIFRVIGILMVTISLKYSAQEPEENFLILKNIKYILIDEAKKIRVFSEPLYYSKILWAKCIDKIRNLSSIKFKHWQKLAFTCGILASTILGDETPGEIHDKLGLSDYEKEWVELITSAFTIMNTPEQLALKCFNCKKIISNNQKCCENQEIYYTDLNINNDN